MTRPKNFLRSKGKEESTIPKEEKGASKKGENQKKAEGYLTLLVKVT